MVLFDFPHSEKETKKIIENIATFSVDAVNDFHRVLLGELKTFPDDR